MISALYTLVMTLVRLSHQRGSPSPTEQKRKERQVEAADELSELPIETELEAQYLNLF